MDTSEVIRTRRSVREYRDEPIDDALLEELVELATLAPSSYNMQPWEFLVCREERTLERLRDCAYDQPQVTDSAATVVLLGNLDPAAHARPILEDSLEKKYIESRNAVERRIDRIEGKREDPIEDRRLWTTKSTSLAAMTLMLAAWDRGIASCPMEGFDADALCREFGIDPESYDPVMLITLGFPAEDAEDIVRERKHRRPIDDLCHFESFGPTT
ncbi:nitroreductase family protein [Natronorarus salvus]|uniref:nitroreductase family protein n=1 Tax=Natronorarus salvus TaxID=3117733 RepID=UPI002F2669B2